MFWGWKRKNKLSFSAGGGGGGGHFYLLDLSGISIQTPIDSFFQMSLTLDMSQLNPLKGERETFWVNATVEKKDLLWKKKTRERKKKSV